MRSCRSSTITLATTSRPAITPMSTAAIGRDERARRGDCDESAEQAVARHRDIGLVEAETTNSIALKARRPPKPASYSRRLVAMRESDAARLEPALKPNHPKARIKVPTIAIGKLCPGIAANLRRHGGTCRCAAPTRSRRPEPAMPPVMCTTEEPAKSTWPCPRPRLSPSCDKPSAAPDPVAV